MHGLVSGLALISIKSSARVRDLRCWMKLADAVIVIRIRFMEISFSLDRIRYLIRNYYHYVIITVLQIKHIFLYDKPYNFRGNDASVHDPISFSYIRAKIIN